MMLKDLPRQGGYAWTPENCEVCFGINPVVTGVIRIHADHEEHGATTSIPCGGCGSTTEENLQRRSERGIPGFTS